jgi:hypothetical protein
MPLINCSACDRQISTEAESCPQCGHPNRAASHSPRGKCYACEAAPTTKCQKCGRLSCAQHLQHTFVPHGRGGANELLCKSCFSEVEASKSFYFVMRIVVGIVGVILLVSFALWGWWQIEQYHQEADRKMREFRQKSDREMEEFRRKPFP